MGQKKGTPRSQLTPELRKEIVELVISTLRREEEHQRKMAYDKRLHNTELLLKNYRSFVVHSESAVSNASQIDDDLDLDELLEMMGCRGSDHDVSVLSVQESATRTRILVAHIDRMLEYFQYKCEHSGRVEDERHWRIIRDRYIVPEDEQRSFQEIADDEHLGLSAIYKSHKEAVRQVSALLFGYVV